MKSNANDIVVGDCLLLHALSNGRVDVFDTLLNSGANPKQCGPDYQAEFYQYWIGGCHGQQFKERFDQLGITPPQSPQELLEIALRGACAEGVEFAVNKGADPNAPRTNGNLPLDSALASLSDRHLETATTLVRLGADPFKVTPRTGQSPYDYAKSHVLPENWPRVEKALLLK
jgi:ankyrin repeat protein